MAHRLNLACRTSSVDVWQQEVSPALHCTTARQLGGRELSHAMPQSGSTEKRQHREAVPAVAARA